ncbi:hypothetical protein METBIDRAFT_78175 [Metschnikowia bicuspidata var. bicuspidata NRRL YB-4993]|uniref:MINDY deubiquitinase domain-containing protein n=1 Tax=Metschnikowia bicuspidata var. bicuspidata NRRL YB-4993 TaxID=869754 RepID=A0A1A0HB47_9ASCO|nr:hypothetical protein METBIDRAFT_78175 [Metschnikowia bicuspidata var. bicuspidata NRRL YB-4993]OBA21113.1 hypothetical protein METBIDRAFT_78175 [Metschnikowia bicuspidata var. bicuspidata NRRL YB-4993]
MIMRLLFQHGQNHTELRCQYGGGHEIRWSPYEQVLPILLQDTNGPCPLIALVNTLILTNDIEKRTVDLQEPAGPSRDLEPQAPPATAASSAQKEQQSVPGARRLNVAQLRSLLNLNIGGTVEVPQILSSLGDLLLDIPDTDSAVLNGLLESLPLLHTGLDVNPNLTTGGFDPEEMASQIFRVFGLNFVHGWCREPSGDADLDAVFARHQTFEALQEYLLTSAENTVQKTHIEAWVQDNASQLTAHGLRRIDEKMQPDSLAIFFRNNHFLTLYKAHNQDLYLLITDDAFLKHANYVWQSINSVSGGDDLYFAGDFTPLMDGADPGEAAGVDESLVFAKQLQEKEDIAYAQKLQLSYKKRAEKTPFSGAGEGPDPSLPQLEDKKMLLKKSSKGLSKEARSKKKDTCVIT